MSRLRELVEPDRGRWKPMLAGLALCGLGFGAIATLQPGPAVEGALMLLSLAAWAAGALAMIGFVRWWFAEEKRRIAGESRATRDAAASRASPRSTRRASSTSPLRPR